MTTATVIIEAALAIWATGCIVGTGLIVRSELRNIRQARRNARQ
jgi:hypothetical protein